MTDEQIEIYDRKGDFLGTFMSQEEAEIFCRNARKRGFNPCTIEEIEHEYDGYE
ncbi:hypothetical protein [Adlercreutzia sp. ZJ154]|uniref:hypothetical protein n=1 Tax=Adlercreutzia sp. ZJ154 TaxID=2709790 RepID=UPI0013EACCD2|nr:hypothetical protein [Adlercreutzia sp. ZJ154]